MSERDGESERRAQRSAVPWIIRGIPYRNSASAFWRRLVDELVDRFSACNRAIMKATGGGEIHPGLLAPEADLAAALESDRDTEDLAEELRERVAQLDLTGPPGPVELTALHDDEVLGSADELIEAVDSEIFLYLVAWLLKWSEAPPQNWNREVVEGGFSARASDVRLIYTCSFSLYSRHISEGLGKRKLDLAFGRGEENHPERIGPQPRC